MLGYVYTHMSHASATACFNYLFLVTPAPTCEPGKFMCKDGACIDEHLVCDLNQDCNDNSDEEKCGINECLNPSYNICSQNCVDTPASYFCTCNPGE